MKIKDMKPGDIGLAKIDNYTTIPILKNMEYNNEKSTHYPYITNLNTGSFWFCFAKNNIGEWDVVLMKKEIMGV